MELLLNEEQKLLKDSAESLVGRYGGPDRARAVRGSAGALDREAWDEVAAAGWLAVLVPEDCGGLGLGMTELALVLEQAGRGLLSVPVAAAAASAAAIAAGDGDGAAALLDDVMGGARLIVPALHETAGAGAPEFDGVRAEAAGGGGLVLTGRKCFIPAAGAADGFLLGASGSNGPLLCHVAADAPGVSLQTTATVDGGAVGTLELSGANISGGDVIAGPSRTAEVAARLNDHMLLGISAELLGIMEQALETTLEYLKVREQFGRPIGSFQALQHRAVNDYASVEVVRSLLFEICKAAGDGRFNPAMAAAAKAKASAHALAVTKSAIQMHGAIGFTDEHDIGLYLKRAMALAAQYGNEAAQRARYARLAGIEPAA